MQTRKEQFSQLYPNEPAFRFRQLEKAVFDVQIDSWNDVTVLPLAMRTRLYENVPFFSCAFQKIYQSKNKDTHKAIICAADNALFESVLMRNVRGSWTICVSSQVGCGMGCTFCATGTMGFKRNLTSDEIVDQYRLWNQYIHEHFPDTRISNIVFMGMGEPLANYENLKITLNSLLTYTDLGATKIMVSTVGVLQTLNTLLADDSWPPVRLAISLHSPDPIQRKEIVPSTVPQFHERLAEWSHAYQEKLGNRNHWLTFEYTLINGVNDTTEDAHALARYTQKTAIRKINVIPYNPVKGKSFDRSQQERIDKFKQIILSYDIDITQRKTMGDDIAAACGQLVVG